MSPWDHSVPPGQEHPWLSSLEEQMIDIEKLQWKEAFLFFYWDIEKFRPEATERVNRLIQQHLFYKLPRADADSTPWSWNALLCGLMRSLQCHLGSNVLPDTAGYLEWLDAACKLSYTHWKYKTYLETTKPYVDWIRLCPHFEKHWSSPSPKKDVRAVLSQLEDAAYGPLEAHASWRTTMAEAWSSNPFLTQFQKVHSVQPWGVPLPLDIEELGEMSWPSSAAICSTAKLECQGDRRPSNSVLRFEVVFHRAKETVNLTLPRKVVLNRRLLNLVKRFYVAMLKWVDTMRHSGRTTSLPSFLKTQYDEWVLEGDNSTMKVNKKLHAAIRAVGLKTLARKAPAPLTTLPRTPVKRSAKTVLSTPKENTTSNQSWSASKKKGKTTPNTSTQSTQANTEREAGASPARKKARRHVPKFSDRDDSDYVPSSP